MHIVDISALYSPTGGGIRTYTRRKLQTAQRFGHNLTVVAPGNDSADVMVARGGRLLTIKSPHFPLDKNYSYFESDAVIHRLLNELKPDFIEASSPWGSSSSVAEWPGAAPRALIMHADPLTAWAYRWFERVAKRETIDRGFDWFWRHLRRMDGSYDAIISASTNLSERLVAGGLQRVHTIPMGVEPGYFSPSLRDPALRERLLARCNLPDTATLVVGVGRFSPEKRWPMVIEGATAAGARRPLGLVIIGDGHARRRVVRAADNNPHILLLAPLNGREEMAQVLASADLLLHGSSAETYGMTPAEARASGLPIIVPDDGAAIDQLTAGAGLAYTAGDAASMAETIVTAIDTLPDLRAGAAADAGNVQEMDRHFAELFALYEQLAASPTR
jgi:alpha-1,6-mannosyltransferase